MALKRKREGKLKSKAAPAYTIFIALLLAGSVTVSFRITPVNAAPSILEVPTVYPTIQEAVDNASDGDIIYVLNGTYFENVSINKPISLVGFNPSNTVVDGNGNSPAIITIFSTTNVLVSGFTVRNSNPSLLSYGVSLSQSSNITIQNVVVRNTGHGLSIFNSSRSRILNNVLVANRMSGVMFRYGSSYNKIIGNFIADNPLGIHIESSSADHNIFYRNSLNNTNQVFVASASNSWDNEAEGNYWADYYGEDDGSTGRIANDGVGDTGIPHLGLDFYPLMEPWNLTRTHVVNSHQVVTICNYTVASLEFDEALKQLSFHITGPIGEKGFCNATIPSELLEPKNAGERWIVMLGSSIIDFSEEKIGNSTSLSFNYTLGLENRVRLIVAMYYPPTADFDFVPSKPAANETITFNGIAVPGNGTVVIWQWNLGDGKNATGQVVEHEYSAKGNYTVTLTVTDSYDLTDTYSKLVEVFQRPIAQFTYSPSRPLVNETVFFNASSSTPNGGIIIQYQWNFGDGNLENATRETINHTYSTFGNYSVSLTVVDSEGFSDAMTIALTVLSVPTARFHFSPQDPAINQTIDFDGSASFDYDGSIVEFRWSFGDGSPVVVETSPVTTHDFRQVGSYQVNLTVRDNDGNEDSAGQVVIVSQLDTTLNLRVPANIAAEDTATLFATLKDEDGKPIYGVAVEFQVHNGTMWNLLGYSATNQSGVASFTYIAKHVGSFLAKASFNGSEIYRGSSSSEQTLTVVSREGDYTLYVVLAVLTVSVFIAYAALRMRRKPPQE